MSTLASRLARVEAFIASRKECPHCRRPVARGGGFPCESGCEGDYDENWKLIIENEEDGE